MAVILKHNQHPSDPVVNQNHSAVQDAFNQTNNALASQAIAGTVNNQISDAGIQPGRELVWTGIAFPAGSPAAGTLFFRIDLLKLYYWSGSAWVQIGAGNPVAFASRFLAYQSASNQVFVNGATATLVMDGVEFDANGDFDNTTYTFTAPDDITMVFGATAWPTGLKNHDYYQLDLLVNGASKRTLGAIESPALGTGGFFITPSGMSPVELTAGDLVKVQIGFAGNGTAGPGSGYNITTVKGAALTYFWGFQIA